ncbi:MULTISPECIES: 3'-5' exonuclease [unclassified Pseudomonas]|uniref:3'-5' exonuclease n=1 Tax=unclassified Pseudomonas TaxID=196821 RepID=UPI00244C8888|nr:MULTISPECIES: 3'-5' exonuclease [unclassified Pseudomonas]MDG9927733.1 3'-5' exonuclease [Pseudomonas sp. GD04042]MDH0483169.1 3'-5' exonuclease [Pseudomonas sp. GD04015]MDH0603965.1 3'-5' exonuclease [Pseudomonas sp. GD03869]
MTERIAVIDFETTGMSPAQGARPTEVGAAMIEGGRIVARYQSLMNAGAWVPPFIEQLTGISNAMVRRAPPVAEVMAEVAGFVGDAPLLAHNAAFDAKFWDAELGLLGRRRARDFACSLLLSRRLLPEAPSHALGNLNRWAGLPDTGQAHRALADAEMAANLALHLLALLWERHDIRADHAYLCGLQKLSAAKVRALLRASA